MNRCKTIRKAGPLVPHVIHHVSTNTDRIGQPFVRHELDQRPDMVLWTILRTEKRIIFQYRARLYQFAVQSCVRLLVHVAEDDTRSDPPLFKECKDAEGIRSTLGVYFNSGTRAQSCLG